MEKITVPDNLRVLAEEIKPLIKEIRDALIERPVPRGFPHPDLESAVVGPIERAGEAVKGITYMVNNFPGCSHSGQSASKEEIIIASSELKRLVRTCIGAFHDIWSRPFPPGYSEGQPLASAVVEGVLGECLSLFEKMVYIVENPAEAYNKYGVNLINLKAEFGDAAARRLDRWLEDRALENRQRSLREACGVTRLLPLAAAFLLGLWMGGDDK